MKQVPVLGSVLLTTSDERTEDEHAMMESDTLHVCPKLEPRTAWMSQLCAVSESGIGREKHTTTLNKGAPTSQLACTRSQRPIGKWYVGCEGAQ